MRTVKISIKGLSRPLHRVVATFLASAVLLCATGGVAFAYFRTSGNGTGSGKVSAALAPVTVSAATTTGTALYPGDTGSPGDLELSATNPNPVDVKVTVTGLGSVQGCTTPALSLVGTPSFTIPKNTTTATGIPLIGAVTMGTSASNDCQGQTLTVSVTVTVQGS